MDCRQHRLKRATQKKITRLLSELTGYKIAFGHVAGVDDTIIDDMQKVIRTRHGNDWANLLPAVGKKVAQSLELDATPEMSNYIADFILTSAPNNTSAESKAFAKAAREHPEIFAAIKSVRDVFQEIADMTPHERVRSKIVSESPKKSLIERIGELYRGGKEEWLDDLDPIKQMLTRIRSELGDNIAGEIEKGIDPYKAARLKRAKIRVGKPTIRRQSDDHRQTQRRIFQHRDSRALSHNAHVQSAQAQDFARGKNFRRADGIFAAQD